MSIIDHEGVERHASILDVPAAPLRCFAFGHDWEPVAVVERQDYGMTVWQIDAPCGCGRVRSDVLSSTTGELLNRSYRSGHGLMSRLPSDRQESRLEWARRTRAAAAGVTGIRSKRTRRRA